MKQIATESESAHDATGTEAVVTEILRLGQENGWNVQVDSDQGKIFVAQGG